MFNLTQAQWIQYVRIAIQWGAASTGYDAFMKGSTGQMITAGLIAFATLLWTAYATRLAAKINELVGAEVITPKVGETLKDVAVDPTVVVSNVETKPVPTVAP